MPSVINMPKDDPTYPHGTDKGYNGGCRGNSPCPAEQTCFEVHSARMKKLKVARRAGEDSARDAKTSQVQRRLRQTIAAVGIKAVAERAGTTQAAVNRVLERETFTIPNEVALPLDAAWAWFVKGSDTQAPGFRHGRADSYSKFHCRCPDCRAAQARVQKLSRTPNATYDHRIIEVPGLAEHVRRCVEVSSVGAAARAAGVAREAVEGALAGDRVRTRTAKALAALTRDKARSAVALVPAAEFCRQRGSVMALGYSCRWMVRQAPGLPGDLWSVKPDETVTRESAAAMRELAARVGDTPATPEGTGLTVQTINRMRNAARRQGYYPPASYDDHGRLDYRALPDHRWSKADERCAKDFPLVCEVAQGTKTASQLVRERFAHDTKAVERMRSALGLRFIYDGDGVHLHPDSVARAAWVRSMIEDYNAGARGPVEVALTIGSRDPITFPKDHPEYVAWEAARTTERKEAA